MLQHGIYCGDHQRSIVVQLLIISVVTLPGPALVSPWLDIPLMSEIQMPCRHDIFTECSLNLPKHVNYTNLLNHVYQTFFSPVRHFFSIVRSHTCSVEHYWRQYLWLNRSTSTHYAYKLTVFFIIFNKQLYYNSKLLCAVRTHTHTHNQIQRNASSTSLSCYILCCAVLITLVYQHSVS